MLFNSFQFILLVCVTFFIYYTPAMRKIQPALLIAASFIFYASNQPVLLLLLIFSITVNTIASYLVFFGNVKFRKSYAVAGVCLNLLTLAFFKYSPLFGKTFFSPDQAVGHFLTMIPLPIGISFFTFQGITLMVDSFRSEKVIEFQKLKTGSFPNYFMNTALFISFFPQLVAGPIVKAHDFIPQIKIKYMKDINWNHCFKSLVLGYFLKMVIADNLKDQTFWIAFPYFQGNATSTILTMLFGYSIQIFSDFAGYSLIAIGVAGLFSYNLPKNFHYPYISKSLSEFWTRWHISLSNFLKEYLYFPLGGNRKGEKRTYINLMVVMVLGGFWHGAAWSYAVWGTFHGAGLATERFFRNRLSIPKNTGSNAIKMIAVFTFVTFAWLLFKLPEFNHFIQLMITLPRNIDMIINVQVVLQVAVYSLPIILYHLIYLYRNKIPVLYMNLMEPAIYGFMLFMIITNSGSPNEFIYFQF
ncbi:MAG: MBOAT family protein [Desulfobacteraceae bacterium]|nr:MAG: MBOAT family protein [Desulfobacteraceae bacterium]